MAPSVKQQWIVANKGKGGRGRKRELVQVQTAT